MKKDFNNNVLSATAGPRSTASGKQTVLAVTSIVPLLPVFIQKPRISLSESDKTRGPLPPELRCRWQILTSIRDRNK
jgi:hypothetical protein